MENISVLLGLRSVFPEFNTKLYLQSYRENSFYYLKSKGKTKFLRIIWSNNEMLQEVRSTSIHFLIWMKKSLKLNNMGFDLEPKKMEHKCKFENM